LLLMIVGGLGVYLREVPLTAWWWFVRQTTMMVTVNDEDAAFVWVKEWLLEQKFLRRIRHLDLDTKLRGTSAALIPAPGRHWFWHGGRPFVVYFYRSDEKKALAQRRSESLTFRTIGRDQSFLTRFVGEISNCHLKKMVAKTALHIFDDYWVEVEGYLPRLLSSVILKAGDKERLVRDIQKFRNSQQRYRQLGLPYHRGYLLYGPPGTGKTSLVSALAAEFALSIYAINLSDFNDRSLMRAINDVPPGSVVLFEDIDCMKSSRARTAPKAETHGTASETMKEETPTALGVTLSGLLNVLDGFHAPQNVLFVMTSNMIENLDPALLRPGRIDYRLYMGPAEKQQKVELYRRFFPLASEAAAEAFVDAQESVATMAEFQGLLLRLEQECAELDEMVAKG